MALHYTTTLSERDGALPAFDSIGIALRSVVDTTTFEDAYPTNRAKSLVHYWLSLVERQTNDVHAYEEILADTFALNLGSRVLATPQEVAQWSAGNSALIRWSSHAVENLTVEGGEGGKYKVKVNFNWTAENSQGQKMAAKTHHEWDIIDQPADRFAKIAAMHVTTLEPFRVVE